MAVDGGCAAVGWWSRGSVAVPRYGAGRWGAGRAAQAESIPLPRKMGRACLLPRAMDGCLPAPASRSVAAGGRAVCRLVRRAVASPSFGSDEAGDPPGLGRPGDADVDQGDTPASPGVSGCRGMASGLVAGGRSDEGRMGRRPSTTGRPLCWRQDEAAAVCQVAIRVPGFLLEAAGGRCAALGSDVRQEGVQRAGGGAAAGKQALVLVGRLS